MALITPSNLYSGEAERFNSQPSVNMAVNLMAKRQAREDALDAYDKNRINSINPKGLRDIDRQGFDAAIADLQQTYRQNKDAIRKGTTPEAFNYEKKFRGISDYISKSQDAAARGETAFKIREEAKKKNQLLPNSFAQEIELNEKPISQGHVPFDYNKWANRPNNFDQSKALARYKDIAPVEAEVTTSPIKGDNFMVLQTTKKKLTPEQKNTVKARAISDYHEMEDFNNAVNTDIADPTKRASLIATYQKHFNEVPKDPEDFAAAKILELKQGELEESKTIPSWAAREKYKASEWDRKNAITFGQSMAKISANKGSGNPDAVDTPYLTDKYYAESGNPLTPEQKAFVQKLGVNAIGYVKASDIDANDYNIITGRGVSGVEAAQPISLGDDQVFLVDENGDYFGDNKKRIRRETVRETVINKRQATKFKAGQIQTGTRGFDAPSNTQPTKKQTNKVVVKPM